MADTNELLRTDIIDCIEEFIDRCQCYNSKIGTLVKLKRRKSGFLCILAVKKILCDDEITISKTAMKLKIHSDLNILQNLFEHQFNFIKDCSTKIDFHK